jgi:hypothetical protein
LDNKTCYPVGIYRSEEGRPVTDTCIREAVTCTTTTAAGSDFFYIEIFINTGNPLKYTDPDGNAAWEPTETWDTSKEEIFRDRFTNNVIKTAQDAIKNETTIDCADVALMALVETASSMGLKLTFDLYDSKERKYINVSSNDSRFNNKNQFMSFVRQNMGAVTLLDDRTTKEIDKITRGDLIMFDLRSDRNSAYQGHTVIMTGVVNASRGIIHTVQGHIAGTPTFNNYTIGNPMYGANPQYREFRFDRLFGR